MIPEDTIPEGYRVKLVRDRLRWRDDLVAGALGYAALPTGRAAFSKKNQIISVIFDGNMRPVELPRMDLEIVDKRWVKYEEEEKEDQKNSLVRYVKKATLWKTPKDGFIELVVEYANGRMTDIWRVKSECQEIIADLRERGLLEETRKRRI